MPVIARLSSRFYEVVGEDVAQQLVDWLNEVEQELTWRARFRSHDELNHARSSRRQMALRSSIPDSLHSAETPMLQGFVDLRAELRRLRSDLIWWMFLSCVSTLFGTLALLVALR
jgi:hypothetical protein